MLDTQPATQTFARSDPFNYPSLNRKDLMSLSSIGANDGCKITTNKFLTKRSASNNLATSDIDGKFYFFIMKLLQVPSQSFTDLRQLVPLNNNGT